MKYLLCLVILFLPLHSHACGFSFLSHSKPEPQTVVSGTATSALKFTMNNPLCGNEPLPVFVAEILAAVSQILAIVLLPVLFIWYALHLYRPLKFIAPRLLFKIMIALVLTYIVCSPVLKYLIETGMYHF